MSINSSFSSLVTLLIHLNTFSPDVVFCGYTVPHPAEQKMHFRIQATEETKAIEVLRRGLKDLFQICDHTLATFEEAMENRITE